MTPLEDVYAEANGRAMMAFLRVSGGEAAIHAKAFGLSPGDCSRAVRRLQRSGRIESMGGCVYRVVE